MVGARQGGGWIGKGVKGGLGLGVCVRPSGDHFM